MVYKLDEYQIRESFIRGSLSLEVFPALKTDKQVIT